MCGPHGSLAGGVLEGRVAALAAQAAGAAWRPAPDAQADAGRLHQAHHLCRFVCCLLARFGSLAMCVLYD